ncbi:hypothetical protein CDB3_32035, partial [Bacillus sp. CDB3]
TGPQGPVGSQGIQGPTGFISTEFANGDTSFISYDHTSSEIVWTTTEFVGNDIIISNNSSQIILAGGHTYLINLSVSGLVSGGGSTSGTTHYGLVALDLNGNHIVESIIYSPSSDSSPGSTSFQKIVSVSSPSILTAKIMSQKTDYVLFGALSNISILKLS